MAMTTIGKENLKKQVVSDLKGFNVEDATKTAAIIVSPRGFIIFKTDDKTSLRDQLLLATSPIDDVAMGSIDSVGVSASGEKVIFGIDCQLTDSVRQGVMDIVEGTKGRISVFPGHYNLLPNRGKIKFYIADKKGKILKELPAYMQNVRPDTVSESIFYSKGADVFAIGVTDAVNENFDAKKLVATFKETVLFLDRVQHSLNKTMILATTKTNDGAWINLPNIGELLQGIDVKSATTSPAVVPPMFKGKVKAIVAMGGKGKFVGILPDGIGFASAIQAA